MSNLVLAGDDFGAGHSRVGATLSSSTVCYRYILRCSSLGPPNFLQADDDFNAGNERMGTILPASSESCARFS